MTFEELLRQADGYRQAGRAGQAQALLARAAAIAAPKAPAQAAELFEDAGRLAARAGAHERAAESYRQALRLARQADAPPAVLARLYAGLARACYACSRLRMAAAAAGRAVRLAATSGDAATGADACIVLGSVLRARGRPREALRAFHRARRLSLKAGRLARATEALCGGGRALMELGEIHRAEVALNRAERECRQRPACAASVRVELARLRLCRGDLTGSVQSVRALLNEAGPRLDVATHASALAVAAEALGQHDPAGGVQAAALAFDLACSLGRPPVLADIVPVLLRLRQAIRQQPSPRERRVARALAAEVDAQCDLGRACATDGRDGRAEATQAMGTSAGTTRGASVPLLDAAVRAAGRVGGRGDRSGPEVPAPAPTGQEIRALRMALGWTQEQLAERAGFEVTTIKRAERNAGVPERTMRALAAAMGAAPASAGQTAARYWRHMGRAYEAMGALREARAAFVQAARLAGASGDLVGEAQAEMSLARLDLRAGEVGGVLGRLERYGRIFASAGDVAACRQVERLTAEAQLALGLAAEAVERLEALLDAPGVPVEDRLELLEVLATACEAAGNPVRADAVRCDARRLQAAGGDQAPARVRQYAEEAVRLHRQGRQAEAAYMAEVAARWASITRALAQVTAPA
ncbi:MAG: helix-turn-helix transcriptional regulator [Armatimonadota bacterium]|nr:helix-turn-helix transcriptional regulator [Armatimonadota bacterium]MDR7533082.1 helix-turn-helix transcriptional regulator [Armatimonadota bacterium]MDR7535886.1 helix-turn-helix transcriptional regulator [Armatimonadota bacterium]